MLRFLRYRSLLLQRRYPKADKSLLGRLHRSPLVHWNESTVTRGVAIGMFWTFIPIPLQMFPATLFCWLIRGNLPIAILCVWISNPITISPILLLEYQLGQLIFHILGSPESAGLEGGSLFSVIGGGLRYTLTGGLALSCFSMIVSYVAVLVAFKFSAARRKKVIQRKSQLVTKTITPAKTTD